MKIAPAVLTALAVVVALVLVDIHARHDERAKFKLIQGDARNDSVAEMLRRAASDSQKAFTRERDSTGRVIRNLQRRIREVNSTETLRDTGSLHGVHLPGVPVASGASASACAGAPAKCDSLIASLLSGRQQDSLQLLFWRAAVVQRDSLIGALQASRNVWRARSERRLACGVGAAVTIGLDGRAAWGPSVGCYVRL